MALRLIPKVMGLSALTVPIVLGLALACMAPSTKANAEQRTRLLIDASKMGPIINRNIFGQFVEHHPLSPYGGIWVGPGSNIPNTRGIRNDVVAALKAIKVPNVRWPGGCVADEYHWRDGIGLPDKRPATFNPAWGGVVEPNTFGTHEFMDFVDQIGAEAYVMVNAGSDTPNEAANWIEYMTTSEPTRLGKERAANGHPAPYKVGFIGIGNESWGCGGDMTPDYYLNQLKLFSHFIRNLNPAQRNKERMQVIAAGPSGGEPTFAEWSDTIMKAYQTHPWSWSIDGLSLHYFTMNWPSKYPSIGFGEDGYSQVLKSTLKMEDLVTEQSAIMDKYDPQKKVALVVDEWGSSYAPLPGTKPRHQLQQNTQRDAILTALNLNIFARHADRVRMANIGQTINVLQCLIQTDQEKMFLTPTYYVYKMYVPFGNATSVSVSFDAGTYTRNDITLPRVDAIAAKDADGKLWLAITNIDPAQPLEIDASLIGATVKSMVGETLTAPRVDSINSFDTPNTVVPKPITARAQNGKLVLTVPPMSVTVVAVEP
jgi:alpha-L-arabinofuranosidase